MALREVHVSYDGTAHIYLRQPSTGTKTELALPAGITSLNRYPEVMEFEKRRFFAGSWSSILMLTEFETLFRAGFTDPTAAAILAAVGGGALTGNHIAYYAPLHKVGSVVIHEGNLSPGSATITFTGTQQRQHTLPATAPDARTTHWRVYVSVDGLLPAFVADVPIGTVTLTENTATADLGDPPPVDEDGALRNARGRPPYTRFIKKWHDRAWYLGDPNFPWRVWYSEQDEMESVGPLNFIDLRGRESVTGTNFTEDELIVQGLRVVYLLHGYDESDFVIRKSSSSIGCVSHWTNRQLDDIPWWAGPRGAYMYTGSFRYLMRDMGRQWRADYAAAPAIFEKAYAAVDEEREAYKILLRYPTAPRSRYYVLHYSEMDPAEGAGASQPECSFDYRDREDTVMANLRRAGTSLNELHTGSVDGVVRKENVATDDSDDGDTYQKLMVIETGAFAPKQEKGDEGSGVAVSDLDVFLMSEQSAWTLEGRAGDDRAYLTATPAHGPIRVPASGASAKNRPKVPLTTHHFDNTTGLAGKSFSIKIQVPMALSVEYRGLAYGWTPGAASNRGLT